jgi:hypothetical protein
VAMAFLYNPNNRVYVNHKDECKTNNELDNLEWCTQKYNVNYGVGSIARNSKVLQFDLNGCLIKEWDSMKQAEEKIGIKYQSISR